MNERHFEFWPKRLPHTLTLPKTSVPYNLKASADRYPEKVAIVYYGTTISYKRLHEEVESLAGYLQRELGVEKGDRVSLYMQNSPQFVVAFYAILRLGAVIVPVNPMSVTEELAHHVEDSGSKVAICGRELYSQLAPLLGKSCLEHAIVAAYSDYLEEETHLTLPDAISALREEVEGEKVIPWRVALEVGRSPEEVAVPTTWRSCRIHLGRPESPKGAFTRTAP
jgi:fatty-acyl-CoA synthase